MLLSALTLRDLEYIVAVDQYKHFTKASQACHVSQPALSAQISKLESQLNITLFERTSKGIRTTEDGDRVIAQAKRVIDQAKILIDICLPSQPQLVGAMRMGAIATLGPYLFAHILQPLKTVFPHLKLLIHEGWTESLLHDLELDQLDAVLAVKTPQHPFVGSDMQMMVLFHEPLWLMLPLHHPLAQQDKVSLKDLDPESMLLLKEGNCLREQTLGLCPLGNRHTPFPFHTASLETARCLVANGDGYTVVPQLAISGDKQWRSLVTYKPIDSPAAVRTVVLLYKKQAVRRFDMKQLGGFLKKTLEMR